MVSFIPPLFYKHVGHEVWIKNQSLIFRTNLRTRLTFDLKKPIKRFLTDHFIKNYIKSIEGFTESSFRSQI
jgi:hypothetical protein